MMFLSVAIYAMAQRTIKAVVPAEKKSGNYSVVDVALSEAIILEDCIITSIAATPRKTQSLRYVPQQKVTTDKFTEVNTMSLAHALRRYRIQIKNL